MTSWKSINFEVFGKVQKVYFRKFTQEKAQELGLKGWVQNTEQGTVIGVAQGPEEDIEQLKVWLATVGSPKSRIDKLEIENEQEIESCEFEDFTVRR
mmetsp:Transcript_17331/g.18070  ORF Transcript_17331/g.18070 Transcript_17331/m.18070 type:complete len:97 (-) Transcript_17331:39-329(-)